MQAQSISGPYPHFSHEIYVIVQQIIEIYENFAFHDL